MEPRAAIWECCQPTLGDFDKAAEHFEHALEMNAASGSRPWLAHAQAEYANLLMKIGSKKAIERAMSSVGASLGNRGRTRYGPLEEEVAADPALGWPHASGINTAEKERLMPRYVIERDFAEQLNLTKEGVEKVNLINDQEGVKWIFSFLSADKKKTYCLYEAPNPEAIRAAARRNNIPADVIIEISGEIGPNMFA